MSSHSSSVRPSDWLSSVRQPPVSCPSAVCQWSVWLSVYPSCPSRLSVCGLLAVRQPSVSGPSAVRWPLVRLSIRPGRPDGTEVGPNGPKDLWSNLSECCNRSSKNVCSWLSNFFLLTPIRQKKRLRLLKSHTDPVIFFTVPILVAEYYAAEEEQGWSISSFVCLTPPSPCCTPSRLFDICQPREVQAIPSIYMPCHITASLTNQILTCKSQLQKWSIKMLNGYILLNVFHTY